MLGAGLVPLLILALWIDPEPAALVARLGSGTVAEREEAARRLEALGREALPALEAARRSPDAEVRSRALPVWGRIQKGIMIRPTSVRIDGRGRPLNEVVQAMGRQGGFSLQLSWQGPEPDINAGAAEALPFWEAVDRLGLGGNFSIVNPVGGHFPTLDFSRGLDPGYPSTISGPFRVRLEGLHVRRDRLLIAGPWIGLDELNPKIPIPPTAERQQDRFYIVLGLMVEPRMWYTQEGPARAIEAVDDLGQSLVRRDPAPVAANRSILHNGGGATQGQVELDLTMPDRPGRTISRLRGVIPVALQMRDAVPALEIPLSTPAGRPIAHEDGVFTLREVHEGDQGTHIVIDARMNLDRLELPASRDRDVLTSRLRGLGSHQVEIVDAEGHVVDESGGGGTRPDGTANLSFMVWKQWHKTRPATFRYYRMIRAFTEVAFEFRDIPMP